MLSLLYLPQTGSDHSFSAGMTLGNTAKKKEWGGVCRGGCVRRLTYRQYCYFAPACACVLTDTHTHKRARACI